jgi:UDP-2-acetamido-2,6-beta-L-arabino-hexul-4-ose reductase
MRIVITGSDGFLGSNLVLRLNETNSHDIIGITEETETDVFTTALLQADYVFHLAGVNRPQDMGEFETGNAQFTRILCEELARTGRRVPVVFTSSIQALLDNPYGRSKLAAEESLLAYAKATGSQVHIFRLPNVFGKWSRPRYNSAVATFCHNLSRGLEISVHDPTAPLHLVYIDDVVAAFLALLATPDSTGGFKDVAPIYETTVGHVVDVLMSFAKLRSELETPRVGAGLARALYATYMSFLPKEAFTYGVPLHQDARGEFAEMLKTPDCGQFSYFSAHPGVTRGEHYHHSKSEKFLVIRGTARFGFRHLQTDETYEVVVRGGEGTIVETAPGWTHNVLNIGEDELIVMLWANEKFDPRRPDTIIRKVGL